MRLAIHDWSVIVLAYGFTETANARLGSAVGRS